MSTLPVLDDDDLQKIYVWVDSIPLTRPKRNISRDFSDGVLVAEVVHHYFPKLVELHNYSPANSLRQKLYNWGTLNQKVFKRLGYEVKRGDVESIVNCKPGVIEAVLMELQQKMADYRAGKRPAEDNNAAAAGVPTISPRQSFYGQAAPVASLSSGSGSGGDLMDAVAHSARAGGVGRATAAAQAINDAYSSSNNIQQQQLIALSGGVGGMDGALVAEKDAAIAELRETIEILELKIKKLEQLVRLKDTRIATLTSRLQGQNNNNAGPAGTAAPGGGVVPGQLLPPMQ